MARAPVPFGAKTSLLWTKFYSNAAPACREAPGRCYFPAVK
jgi:hypothetical protein